MKKEFPSNSTRHDRAARLLRVYAGAAPERAILELAASRERCRLFADGAPVKWTLIFYPDLNLYDLTGPGFASKFNSDSEADAMAEAFKMIAQAEAAFVWSGGAELPTLPLETAPASQYRRTLGALRQIVAGFMEGKGYTRLAIEGVIK